MAALIISNEETDDIMKICKFLEESGLLMKGINQVSKNEGKEQTRGFLGILLGTLGASLFGNLLIDKGVMGGGEDTRRVSEGKIGAIQNF